MRQYGRRHVKNRCMDLKVVQKPLKFFSIVLFDQFYLLSPLLIYPLIILNHPTG